MTLIKFDLKRAKKRLHCVKNAKLNLYSLTDEKYGGVINTYDPNIFSRDELWDELSIMWSNAPKERPYTYYKEIGRVRKNQWVEVDVVRSGAAVLCLQINSAFVFIPLSYIFCTS